jgi:addiction module RelE/StbE family toxin
VRVVWAARVQRRLQEIVAFISNDRPAAAERVLDQILLAARTLGEHPNLGRRGRLRGTREFVVAGTAYLLIYRVQGDVLQVLTVFDGRRRWPPER